MEKKSLSRILLKALHYLCSVMQCVKLSFMTRNFEKWRKVMVLNFLNLVLKIELDRCIGTPMYIGRYDDVADVSYRQISADIQHIGNICSWKCCAVALHGAFGNPSCYFVSDPDWLTQLLCPVPSAQSLHAYGTLCNSPDKTLWHNIRS